VVALGCEDLLEALLCEDLLVALLCEDLLVALLCEDLVGGGCRVALYPYSLEAQVPASARARHVQPPQTAANKTSRRRLECA